MEKYDVSMENDVISSKRSPCCEPNALNSHPRTLKQFATEINGARSSRQNISFTVDLADPTLGNRVGVIVGRFDS